MSVPILKTNSRWDTKNGLLVYGIDIFGISLLFVSILLASKMISLNLGWILLLVPVASFVIVWLFRRSYFWLFFSQKINIVFILDLKDKEKSTLKSYKETLRELNRKLIENNLKKHIKVIEKPEDMKFESKDAAEAKTKLGLYGSTLIIWGDIMESSGKYKLFFSYQFGYPGKEENYYKSIFNHHIDKAFINRSWAHKGPESVEILADDLLQVALYILGFTAVSFGRFNVGSKLFEIIRSDYETIKNLLRRRDLGKFISEVNQGLVISYMKYLQTYENLIYESEYNNAKKDYENMKFFADKILEINYNNQFNYLAHISLALYYEQKGEREKSKEQTKIAEDIHPQKQNLHILNKAYYAIADYDFPVAIKLYEELLRFNYDISGRLRSFLANKGKKYNNLGFCFFEIFIAHYFDKDLKYSKREFKKLIKKMERDNSSKYQILISKVKELTNQ